MRKIGIITIEGNKNYGNKLQNYALQTVLENYGFDVYTLFQKKSLIRKSIRNFKYLLYNILLPNKKSTRYFNREKKFIAFSKNFLHIMVFDREKIKKLDDYFDMFVIGSDQVWNPCVIDKYLGLEILYSEKKVISYAPSIAQSSVDDEYSNKIKQNFTVEKIPYISVREETGKKIISNITGRNDVECVLDPTLLIDKSQWNNIIKKPNFYHDEKYILCYFLGEMSDKRKEKILSFAAENNCKVIDILDANNKAYYSSPNEFLYLEKNAFAIFTDSFHASVFAFLFETPLYILEREGKSEDMSSRLIDFTNKFKLSDRYIKDDNLAGLKLNNDYSIGYKILEKERKKSLSFLEKALEIKKVCESDEQ